MSEEAIIPFGKYKGRKLDDVMAVDRPYLDWLIAQPWFREKNPNLVTIIINGGLQPDADTPEHNRLQIRFLNPKLCDALWLAVFKEYRHQYWNRNAWQEAEDPEKFASTRFEANGWDLIIKSSWDLELPVELKPAIGDDFPSILRKINARRRQAYRCAVVAQVFDCESASFNEVKEMFVKSSIHLFLLNEIIQKI